MSPKQKTILWIGIVLIVIMGLYPPWIITGSWQGGQTENPGGYYFLTNPPTPDYKETTGIPGAKVDFSRLVIQWIIVVVIAGGLIISVRSKSNG